MGLTIGTGGRRAGGTSPSPTQEKTIEITENGQEVVVPDEGFALSKVTVDVNVVGVGSAYVLTYFIEMGIPSTVVKAYIANESAVLETPEDLGIVLPEGYEFGGWEIDGVAVTEVMMDGDKTVEGIIVEPVVGSYFIDTNNVRHDFELGNTPIANFCSAGSATTSITVNGVTYTKNKFKEIVFGSSYKAVTTLPDYFIHKLSNLTSIVLSGLSNVTSVGTYAFSSCTSLGSMDFSSWKNIISIGDYFCSGSGVLTSVNISSFNKVAAIGTAFFYNTKLTSLDLSALSNAVSIGSHFLYNNNTLTSLDLSPLSKVTSIGNHFLAFLTNLNALDLSPLGNVTNIGNSFLHGDTGLNELQIGDIDWSIKTVSTTNIMTNVPNIDTSILRADTQALADTFKAKVNGVISNWRVSLN